MNNTEPTCEEMFDRSMAHYEYRQAKRRLAWSLISAVAMAVALFADIFFYTRVMHAPLIAGVVILWLSFMFCDKKGRNRK